MGPQEEVERALLIERVPRAVQERLTSLAAVVHLPGFPGGRLHLLHPGQHILGEECPSPVVPAGIPLKVKPAMRAQLLADLVFEGDFLVDAYVLLGQPFTTAERSATACGAPGRSLR